MTQDIILTFLEHSIQIRDERRPIAKVAHFATAQILHFEAEIVRVGRARFDPQAQGKELGVVLALWVHQSQCLHDRERATVLGG